MDSWRRLILATSRSVQEQFISRDCGSRQEKGAAQAHRLQPVGFAHSRSHPLLSVSVSTLAASTSSGVKAMGTPSPRRQRANWSE